MWYFLVLDFLAVLPKHIQNRLIVLGGFALTKVWEPCFGGYSQSEDWRWLHWQRQQPWYFCMKVKVKSHSRVRLCDPMDCSPPGSSVHGILQARILEWDAISFSRGSSWPRNWTQVSYPEGGFFTTESAGRPISCHRAFACMDPFPCSVSHTTSLICSFFSSPLQHQFLIQDSSSQDHVFPSCYRLPKQSQ